MIVFKYNNKSKIGVTSYKTRLFSTSGKSEAKCIIFGMYRGFWGKENYISIFVGKIDYNSRMYSSATRSPLSIEDGTFSYTKDIKLNSNIKWVGGKTEGKSLAKIGWFKEEMDLGKYGEFKNNIVLLDKILKSFSPFNSYSLAVMIYQGTSGVKTVDYHYLVNNTTNAEDLMTNIYSKIVQLTIRYKFKIGDVIICRYKPLYYKVNDPKFTGGKINNTVYKPTEVKLDVNTRLLSTSFLPHTMNIHYYGVGIQKQGNRIFYNYKDKYVIKVEIIEWGVEHKIEIINPKNNKLIADIYDIKYGEGFIREINTGKSNVYLYYDNQFKLLNMEFEPKITYLKPVAKDIKHNINILTFDIETYKDVNNKFIPYACGFYDGKRKFLYYLTDYNSPQEMISQCIKDMVIPKYHNHVIYAHNLGGFDISFILVILFKNYKISNILPRDTTIMSFTVTTKINGKTVKLKFSDSICLLPSSLSKLGESFKVNTRKDYFPYSFVKEDNLEYVGNLPDMKYFDEPNFIFRYQLMTDWYTNNWSLKDETLKYLSKDIISLYEIIGKMDEIVFSNYRINITSLTTIASLSFKIIRSNYLKNDKLLGKCRGELEYAIRESYFGGRCEVFKPYGYNLLSYDFNSLYPFAMMMDLPVGQPTFSLVQDLSKIFGFIKVEVTAPDNLYTPVLPCKIRSNEGDKLIFPLGSWTGWYFSEEVKLAVKYGYKIKIIESYIYERGENIFTDYIKTMANIKDNSEGAMRDIHKLLMNTPYGRFGMRNDRDVIKLVSLAEFEQLELKYNITFWLKLDEDKILVKYSKFIDKMKCEQSDIDYDIEMQNIVDSDNVNNSPAIASAVSSWARIVMYPKIINSYYTDTDSIFVKEPLNKDNIGKKIGLFKQEYGGNIKKAIFPSPKFYILDTISGLKTKSKGFSGKLSLMDYLDIYKGGFIQVKDVRWKRYLGLETIYLQDLDYVIKGEYDKRNKLYSKGAWVDTSPLIINPSFQIVSTNLIIRSKNLFSIIKYKELTPPQNKLTIFNFNLELALTVVPLNSTIFNKIIATVPEHNTLKNLNLEQLSKEVNKAIYDSKFLAANQTEMHIYRLTGILYGSQGNLYYYNSDSKRVNITKKGKYIYSNVRIIGGYLYINRKKHIP